MENTKNQTMGVLKAAWLIALVTIASKLIGFVRDMVVANFYGATLVSDAYFYALQIPSLAIIILGGVGGPFHRATVAVFSNLIPKLLKVQILFEALDPQQHQQLTTLRQPYLKHVLLHHQSPRDLGYQQR